MNGLAVASQSGRSTRRTQGATPVRDTSPSRRSSRAGGRTQQSTPGTRRSARAGSSRPDQSKDVVANPALPEIQTRQSYAYGSTKAPVLPEQLHARETMSLRQVAQQMDTDINRAQRNLGDHVSGLDELRTQQKSQDSQQAEIARERGERQPSEVRQAPPESGRPETPASQTTELRKQQRTAAWASSLDDSQLDDIAEESSSGDTPESRRTDPSSFPSININHSYAYERGVRAPRVERVQRPSRVIPFLKSTFDRSVTFCSTCLNVSNMVESGFQEWLYQFCRSAVKVLFDLPKSTAVLLLIKTFYMLCLTGLFSMLVCFAYRNHLCDPTSTSQISQVLQSVCGTCTNNNYLNYGGWNISNGGIHDAASIQRIAATLGNINKKIVALESRLNQRIDSKHMSLQSEMDSLRRQQSDLSSLLENIGQQQGPETDVTSPLIPRVNFFAPANGAIVNPWHTSPTRSKLRSLPARIVLGLLNLKKYDVNGPLVALQPWQDVGDCWCASTSTPGQDRVRLGVGLNQLIYPTELVIEHPPTDLTLTPETAPKEIELWANMDHLTDLEYKELDIDSLRLDDDDNDKAGLPNSLFSINSKLPGKRKGQRTWAKFASVQYELSSASSSTSSVSHVQRFKLNVNQYANEMKYPAREFILRVRSTHGAEYGCLYRVRLHGVPVDLGQSSSSLSSSS